MGNEVPIPPQETAIDDNSSIPEEIDSSTPDVLTSLWSSLFDPMAGATDPKDKGWIVPHSNQIENKTENSQDEAGTVVGGLFSTRKPKDMGAGLSSGLKSVGKGLAVGAASLVVCPVVGAKEEGVGGFFKGVGAGVLAAVSLPIAGVTIAGYQLSRGLMNTPEAVNEKTKGRKWDKKNREWKDNWYSLSEEHEKLLLSLKAQENNMNASSSTDYDDGTTNSKNKQTNIDDDNTDKKKTPKKTVADTQYYDALDVSPDASQSEIRRQYYKLARTCHPDKNQDDPEAAQKFQKIGEAYQVLGDEERRAEYDEHGAAAASDMPIIDSSLFFMMLFGSEKLEPYIGKLKMAMFVEMVDTKDLSKEVNASNDKMNEQQQRREILLAVALRDRLHAYVESARTAEAEKTPLEKSETFLGWRKAMQEEAVNLCKSSFGDAIVEAVGWVYENYSCQFLGKMDTFWGLGGRYAKMQAQSRNMGNSWKTASAAVRAALAARKIQQKEERASRIAARKKKRGERLKRNKKSPPMNDTKTNHESENPDKDNNVNETNDDNNDSDDDATRAATDAARNLEETLPLILETMLNICLMDIEVSVRAAAKRVLKDMSVDLSERRLRAEGLIILGEILQTAAEDHKKDHANEKVDARRHMEDAFIRAAQKADEKA